MNGFYLTDHGHVFISDKTAAYLRSVSPDWEKLANTKPRSKAGKEAKARIEDVFTAIRVCAAIEWHSGGELRTF